MPAQASVTRVNANSTQFEERNDKLGSWLQGTEGGTGRHYDIRSITWVEETSQWVVVYFNPRD